MLLTGVKLTHSSCVIQCLRDVHIHHLRLLLVLGQIASVLLFPVWMYTDVWDIITQLHKVCHTALSYVLLQTIIILSLSLSLSLTHTHMHTLTLSLSFILFE